MPFSYRQEEAGIRQASKNLPSGGLLSNLDSRCNIQKTPGNRPGAELQLEDLLEQKIEEHVSKTIRDLCVHLSDC